MVLRPSHFQQGVSHITSCWQQPTHTTANIFRNKNLRVYHKQPLGEGTTEGLTSRKRKLNPEEKPNK